MHNGLEKHIKMVASLNLIAIRMIFLLLGIFVLNMIVIIKVIYAMITPESCMQVKQRNFISLLLNKISMNAACHPTFRPLKRNTEYDI